MTKFKKKLVQKKIVILSAFVFGIFISTYIKILDNSEVYMSLDQKQKLESEIKYTENEIHKLNNVKNQYNEILKKYMSIDDNDEKTIINIMKKELENLKLISGYEDMEGEGIELTIKDSDNELKKNQNPNDLLVHDADILKIINDIKESGAQAISINNERLVSSSEIKCSGATITINGVTHGQPFIIKAIGNVELLKFSLNSPNSYTKILEEIYGIYVKIEEKDSIFIKSYEKDE